MLKQKVFFDTNVCNEIARRPDANELLAAVGKRFEIVASPMVFAELVIGLDGTNAQHWQQHKNRVRAAVGNGKIKFLKLPREFAFAKVIGIPKRVKVSPEKFSEWTRIILMSNSKDAVFEKSIELGYMVEAVLAGWERHSKIVLATAENSAPMPSAIRWTELVVEDFGATVNSMQVCRLAEALSPAYQRIVYLRNLYSNRNSMPENRRGDWIDVLNLFYLCDPAIRFVTNERKLIRLLNLRGPIPQLFEFRQLIAALGLR